MLMKTVLNYRIYAYATNRILYLALHFATTVCPKFI